MQWLWARACLDRGDVGQATETVTEAIARARAHSHRLVLVDAPQVAAMVAARQGHWEEARIALEETLALATPFPYAMGKALAVYGDVHAARGEADDARERYGAALAILGRLGERLYAEPTARALNALHRGTRP